MSIGGGQEKAESKSQSQTFIPAQKKWLEEALSIYGPQLGQGENIYPGETVAPFTSGQEAALALGPDFLDSFSAYRDMPLFGETGTALSKVLSGEYGAKPLSTEEALDTFKTTRALPARREWSENVAPLIREEYAGPGYWSSARAGQVSESAQDLEEALTAERGEFLWNVEEANRAIEEAKAQRALQATGLGMEYAGLPTQEATARLQGLEGVFGFMGREQIQQQAEINAAIERFAAENRITSAEDMAILMGLLGLNYGSSYGKSSASGWSAKISLEETES